jgi:hypothetical protein
MAFSLELPDCCLQIARQATELLSVLQIAFQWYAEGRKRACFAGPVSDKIITDRLAGFSHRVLANAPTP